MPLGRWPACKMTPLKWLKDIIFGCRAHDGHRFWCNDSRLGHMKWLWNAFIIKWIKSPLRCKRGIHRISANSDTGMGCDSKPGHMDVWCKDCDRMLEVPIDDAMTAKGYVFTLGLWRKANV